MSTFQAKGREFVVSAHEQEKLAELAHAASGELAVKLLPGDRQRRIVTVADSQEGVAEAWQRLSRRLGSAYQVLPVLTDRRGNSVYPTGRVEVRFLYPVAADALEAFAERHRLALVERNSFQAEQAMFEPRDASQFLLSLVDSIGRDPAVRLAWPETQSQYRKA